MASENKQQYRLENLSCANCAAKFERNVKEIPTVTDAKLNFGAAKITVYGDATIEQLERAGDFDGIKVSSNQNKVQTKKVRFYKQQENILAGIALLFIAVAFILGKTITSTTAVTSLYFLAIITGGINIFKVGFVYYAMK